MCRAVACKQCGKTTWAGCGQHVDQVMRAVPRAQQCQGHQSASAGGSTGAGSSGVLRRIFGR